MKFLYPNTAGTHLLSRPSVSFFSSLSVQRTIKKLYCGRHATNSIRVELNRNSISKNGGQIESVDKFGDLMEESDECVEVIVVGSRIDAVLDFCSGSPFISHDLRFWNVVGSHPEQVQLQQRLTKKDSSPITFEHFSAQQSSCKAVILVASAAFGSDHITALDVLSNIKSRNGFVVGIILKPFSFEGQRRQNEVKDLVTKLQSLANFCIVLDTDVLLEKDLVTLDEALRISNNAVSMAMNAISVLTSEKYVKLLNKKDNSTRELHLPEFTKIFESYTEARIGFGAGRNVKTSFLQAVNDCPFFHADVKDIDGEILCIFSSSDVTNCGNADTILQTVRQITGFSSEIIVSIVHEPNLESNTLLATVIVALGDTKRNPSPRNSIFSSLGRHFPFIFNIFKNQHQPPVEEGDLSKSSEATNSPAVGDNDMPDANLFDVTTEDTDEEFSYPRNYSINSVEQEVDFSEPQTYKRELLTRGNTTESAKIGSNSLESTALVDYVNIYHLPVGVKCLDKMEETNTKHEAQGRDEYKKKQANVLPNVSWSRFAEAGAFSKTDVDNYDFAINKGTCSVGYSKKQGGLSSRAASMLESERDSEKKWNRVVEMNYRGGIYKGCTQGGLPEGKGRLLLGDGSSYDGMWRYGKRSGVGTFCFDNGDMFQGSWRDDVMHGKGWFYFHTGDRWFVNLWKGKANGEGRFYSKLGDVLFGHFKEGWRHGKFLRINVDGTRSREVWDEGVLVSDEHLDSDAETD